MSGRSRIVVFGIGLVVLLQAVEEGAAFVNSNPIAALFLGLAGFAAVILVFHLNRKGAEIGRKRDEQTKAEHIRRLHADEVARLEGEAAQLFFRASAAGNALQAELSSTNEALDNADREFSDGAFSPFWDEIEQAVRHLAKFQECLKTIEETSRSYNLLAPKLTHAKPIDVGISKMPDVQTASRRLQEKVRLAQKSFEFASIYEQRRANQLLISNFDNLGDAVSRIGSHLTASLTQLGNHIDGQLSRLDEQNSANLAELESLNRSIKDQVQNKASTVDVLGGFAMGVLINEGLKPKANH